MGSNTTGHWEDDPKRRWLFIIDVIGVCNLRCPSCPVGNYSEIKQPSGMMEPSLLEAILRKATGECRVGYACLYNWSEPLLHPQLPEMVRIVRDCDLKCGLPRVASELDYPVIIPNWDNTPRSGRYGSVLHGSTPELFRWHLREAIERASERPPEHQIVFIKSWNEWAEGNYLEPDLRHGRAYLEVVRDEVRRIACAGAGSIGAAVR
jgi:hypothetical protein